MTCELRANFSSLLSSLETGNNTLHDYITNSKQIDTQLVQCSQISNLLPDHVIYFNHIQQAQNIFLSYIEQYQYIVHQNFAQIIEKCTEEMGTGEQQTEQTSESQNEKDNQTEKKVKEQLEAAEKLLPDLCDLFFNYEDFVLECNTTMAKSQEKLKKISQPIKSPTKKWDMPTVPEGKETQGREKLTKSFSESFKRNKTKKAQSMITVPVHVSNTQRPAQESESNTSIRERANSATDNTDENKLKSKFAKTRIKSLKDLSIKKKSKSRRDSQTTNSETPVTLAPLCQIEYVLENLENGNEILFDFDPQSNIPPKVRYATKEKLVELLTLDTLPQDLNVKYVFLTTYKIYMSDDELLDLFMERFANALIQETDKMKLDKIILRVIGNIRTWIDIYPQIFMSDNMNTPLHSKLLEFVNDQLTPLFPNSTKLITATLKAREKTITPDSRSRSRGLGSFALEDFSVLLPDRICFLGINAAELARQLTILTHHSFMQLLPTEFFRKNWIREDRAILAPNILRIIDIFNHITRWLITEILQPIQLKARVQALKHIVELGQRFKDLNNFHGMMAVVAALQCAPIQRLKATFAELAAEDLQQIKEIEIIMSYEGNYKNYREILRNLSDKIPVVIHIGVFLKDLTFVEDGNSTFFDSNKVNFTKLTMISEIVNQIQRFQAKYAFTEIPAITEWFLNYKSIDEETAYALSTKVEPRDTSEAFETLLLTEATLRKQVEELAISNEALLMQEKRDKIAIAALSEQLREQRKNLARTSVKLTSVPFVDINQAIRV